MEECLSESNTVRDERSIVHETIGEEHVDDSDRKVVLRLVSTGQDDLYCAVVETCLELVRKESTEKSHGCRSTERSEMFVSHVDAKLHRFETAACVVVAVVVNSAPR